MFNGVRKRFLTFLRVTRSGDEHWTEKTVQPFNLESTISPEVGLGALKTDLGKAMKNWFSSIDKDCQAVDQKCEGGGATGSW